MRFNSLITFLFRRWVARFEGRKKKVTTTTLLGEPGIGKTSLVVIEVVRLIKDYLATTAGWTAEKIGEYVEGLGLDLSSMLPEDLLGLPFRQGEATSYCPHAWLQRFCRPEACGVLCLDDLPAAAKAVQVASRQIVLTMGVHEFQLSPNVLVVVTGNRREDKSAASKLPSHFINSTMLIDVEQDLEDWCKWYGAQTDCDPIVAAFLRFKPEHHSKLPSDQDDRGVFATPRTWEMVGREYEVASECECVREMAQGLVGEGIGREFAAFVKVRAELVDPEAVLDDPLKALPNPGKKLDKPDKLVAMATALGEIAAARIKKGEGKTKKAKEAPLKLLRALAHATQMNREYCGAGVSTFVSNAGMEYVPHLVKVARANRQDPTIGKLLTFLRSALLEGN